MSKRKGGLGKGLSALLDDYKDEDQNNTIQEISIHLLQKSPYQPRTDIDAKSIQELSQSIQENGLIEPLVVRQCNNRYELIAGHRRLEALKLLNKKKVPVYVLQISDKQAAQLTIIENIQREDLNAIDLATSLHNLIQKFSLTHEECSNSIGKSRVYVTNLLRLLQLDEKTQNAIRSNSIQESHGRLLLSIKDSALREKILQEIITNKWSVKQLDLYLKKIGGKKKEKHTSFPQYKNQQIHLGEFLNKPVKIFHNHIQIKFKDEKELQDIFQHLQLPYNKD